MEVRCLGPHYAATSLAAYFPSLVFSTSSLLVGWVAKPPLASHLNANKFSCLEVVNESKEGCVLLSN